MNFREDRCLCNACQRTFPIVLGIPDLRVYPDPYITMEDDWRKGALLEERAAALRFDEVVRFYWEITPETPPDLKERFIRHVLTDEERANNFLRGVPLTADTQANCLDVGCGTGAFLKVASRQYRQVIGCDIAFRWLIVARKRLLAAGVSANLVCCCADYLPFPEETFQSVVSISLLEHLPKQQFGAIREFERVLEKGGRVWAVSTNRYSLTPEPHVGIRGVGYLPRRWMPVYVRWRRGLSYDKYLLPSFYDLRRLFQKAGFGAISISVPSIGEADLQRLRWPARTGARIFCWMSRVRFLQLPLLLVSPLLQVAARKRAH